MRKFPSEDAVVLPYARQRRAAVVESFLEAWIGQEGAETGILVKESDASFGELKRDVEAFRAYGKSATWKLAIDKSLEQITYCFHEFVEEMALTEEREEAWERDIDYWAFEMRKHFARLLKHAVWQTIFYCANI